jgi:hypothetical protein
MEYRIVDETPTFFIGVGTMPKAKLEEYIVINKEYGVVEYNNPILYFVLEWTRQMEEALAGIGDKPSFPPPSKNDVN